MKITNKNEKGIGGLRKTPKDVRDFKLSKLRGVDKKKEEVPLVDFVVAEPLEIKNQYNSDFCVGFATTAVSEDQEGVILSPEWFFAQIKKIEGNFNTYGANLRDGCRAAVKFGFIEKEQAPFSVENRERNFLANWENWPTELNQKALKHRKKSYFRIDDENDIFEAIRRVLWQYKDKKCSVLTGACWRAGWSRNPIIDDLRENDVCTGHAFKIFGQKIINGKPYLVAQLSGGEEDGDHGRYYFSKEVVNKTFIYGAFMFLDLDPEEQKKTQWSWWVKIIDKIKKFIKKYLWRV